MKGQIDKGLMPTSVSEQREIPRMLDDMMSRINEIEERLGDLACAISPVLAPSVPTDKVQKMVTPPLGAPLATALDQANTRLYQIQSAIREITSRVQL